MSISIIIGPIRVEDVFTMTLLKYVVSYGQGNTDRGHEHHNAPPNENFEYAHSLCYFSNEAFALEPAQLLTSEFLRKVREGTD